MLGPLRLAATPSTSTDVPSISTAAVSSAVDHSNEVISLSKSELKPPVQPSLKYFPVPKGLRLNVDFYNQFPGLEYNVTKG